MGIIHIEFAKEGKSLNNEVRVVRWRWRPWIFILVAREDEENEETQTYGLHA